MKAIRVHEPGGPEVMCLEEIPDLTPGPGEVVVAVRAAGVNPVDTYIRAGGYGTVSYPYTPGMDASGIVEAVGEGVTRVAPGDRVYTARTLTGAYAEKTLCAVAQVRPLPENVTFQQGAGVYVPYASAWRALFQRARAVPGETVLVHGASGGVGTAAVQIAVAAGLTVIGTAGTEAGRCLVTEQGAHHVLDHTRENYLQQALDLTDGRGVDVILEMLANVNLDRDLGILARGGRIVVIGSRGRIEIDPRQAMTRDAGILGMLLLVAPDEDLESIHAALQAGLRNGTLRPVVGRTLPLAEAPEAHRLIMAPGAHGKIVLVP